MVRSASASPSSPVILLPPSEGKVAGGSRVKWTTSSGLFGRRLSRWRTQIVEALEDLDGGDATLLGVTGHHLEHARAINSSLVGSPTMPASLRYAGVVWNHIDVPSFSPAAAARARASVVVVSGLLGLVGFDDPIPDYKLKIGAALDLPSPTGEFLRQTLSAFWRPRLSPILDQWLEGRVVLDLLPNEHRRAWDPSPGIEVLRARFVDRQGRTAGHDAKAAKGEFVRYVLTARSPLLAIERWTHPEFELELSADT